MAQLAVGVTTAVLLSARPAVPVGSPGQPLPSPQPGSAATTSPTVPAATPAVPAVGSGLSGASPAVPGASPAVPVTTSAMPAVPAATRPAVDPVVAFLVERDRAVRALLVTRARAVLRHDRTAFLATIDPSSVAFRARQTRVFSALAPLPLGSWDYVLDTGHVQPGAPALDRRYRASWWAPGVALRYSLRGWDSSPTIEPQHLTFVRRAGRWLIAADDDFTGRGGRTTRDLWDYGAVTVVAGRRTLVLGHPGSRATLRRLAAETDAAVPRVTSVWGPWYQRVVVLVPDSQRELAGLIGSSRDLSQIAAVATAEIPAGDDGHPVGDRVIINPPGFDELGPIGRQVVLDHEVTHLASRSSTGPLSPTWLVEGLADHVAFRQVDLPLTVTSAELVRDVRAGRVPVALPGDAAFAPDAHHLSQAYEQASFAVDLLVERYGTARTLAFYRDVGAVRGGTSTRAVDAALGRRLGTSLRAFTAVWRAQLRVRFA